MPGILFYKALFSGLFCGATENIEQDRAWNCWCFLSVPSMYEFAFHNYILYKLFHFARSKGY